MNHQVIIPANASRFYIIKTLIAFIWNLPADKAVLATFTDYKPERTLTQNKAMHKYFSLLANAFNDAGYTVEKVLTKPLNISWTEHLVKDILWRQVQEAMYGKKSTKELERVEVSKVYEEINNYTASSLGVHVPFPSKENKS